MNWTVKTVKKIILKTDVQVIKAICDEKIKIITFETAYDKWKCNNGQVKENEVIGLHGNSRRDMKKIRLAANMNNEQTAITLFHEMGHLTRMPPTNSEEALQEEIEIRVETEEFAIRQGMLPTSLGYRTANGKVDHAFIEAQVRNCSHYNPFDAKLVSRRYVGEKDIIGWCPP